jgi:hypothetical protein
VQLIRGKIYFLILLVLPAGIEPLPSAKDVCCPANTATDPLGKLLSMIAFSPAEGTAVHVPPPATVFAILYFITRSTWKVCCFSSHLVLYHP